MASYSRDGQKSYFEHDDRGGGGKSGHSGRRGRARYNQRFNSRGDQHTRNFSRSGIKLDDDGDFQMAGDQHSRFNPYRKENPKGRGAGSRRHPQSQFQSRNEQFAKQNPKFTWNKILIPYGANLDKKFVLDNLTALCDRNFVPVQYRTESGSAVFFIEDRLTAQAIGRLDKKITCPNGRNMAVIVRNCPPPNVIVDTTVINKIKETMGAMYNAHTKALDLSNFVNNPVLVSEGIYAPLYRHNIFNKVVEIIIQSIPDIVGLDLSENKIVSLDCLAALASKAPNMKVLLLAKNQVSRMGELDRIKSWDLEELSLEGNPVCGNYKERSSANYIRFENVVTMRLACEGAGGGDKRDEIGPG